VRLRRSLILASGSPRRRQLLEDAGLSFEVAPAPPEHEAAAAAGLAPGEAAERRAAAKAEWAAGRFPEAVILAADTVVVLGGEALGKPADAEEARAMLARLSGRPHRVVTGFALVGPGLRRLSRAETRVWFRPLDGDAIARYVATGEPMDKAGAYGIQGRGGALVDRIEGSYTNVVGLPLAEVFAALAECGILDGGPPVASR